MCCSCSLMQEKGDQCLISTLFKCFYLEPVMPFELSTNTTSVLLVRFDASRRINTLQHLFFFTNVECCGLAVLRASWIWRSENTSECLGDFTSGSSRPCMAPTVEPPVPQMFLKFTVKRFLFKMYYMSKRMFYVTSNRRWFTISNRLINARFHGERWRNKSTELF